MAFHLCLIMRPLSQAHSGGLNSDDAWGTAVFFRHQDQGIDSFSWSALPDREMNLGCHYFQYQISLDKINEEYYIGYQRNQ